MNPDGVGFDSLITNDLDLSDNWRRLLRPSIRDTRKRYQDEQTEFARLQNAAPTRDKVRRRHQSIPEAANTLANRSHEVN